MLVLSYIKVTDSGIYANEERFTTVGLPTKVHEVF